jgi:DNA-binding transcriptional regulator GbsR (MarR family)
MTSGDRREYYIATTASFKISLNRFALVITNVAKQ